MTRLHFVFGSSVVCRMNRHKKEPLFLPWSSRLFFTLILTLSLITAKGGVSGTIFMCSQELYTFDKSLIS